MESIKRISSIKMNGLITTITILMLWMNCLVSYAQKVTLDEAKSKANAFFTKTIKKSAVRKVPRKAPQLVLANECEEYYIFNDEANTGYAIVSGDERTPDVLAYSESGHYDSENVPCNMQMVLDIYAEQIAYLQSHPDYKMPAVNSADETKIAPLLGETAWAQDSPYNNMCPTIDGKHCPTGCVATATAQIMYYHKWPERGKGIHSYEWNGQTLSVDFSQSEYRWDLMTPTYNSNSSQESCDAVALLMRDVGYACTMGYRKYESAGVLRPSSLCNYFDYDNDMRYLARSMCDADTWNSIILDELVNGRPLYYDGDKSSESGSGHALVIDGYDGNGYFHFNFGWGGLNNGYYTMLTIPYGYGTCIKYRIKKNEGGKPGYLFYSREDFAYVPETDRLVAYHLGWEDRDRNEAGVTIQVALAVENIDTHDIQYYYISDPNSRVNVSFQLTEVLPDGNYILYPVARKDQNYAWEKFFFKEERQSFVDLNVTNGVKTYANNHISDNIQKGTIVVDGIYYILDETNHEAKVSYKNDKYNSYSGDVIIPANIEYENQQYSVTRIGNYAFSQSDKLTSVVIPSSVTYIESNAFSESGLKSIEIPNSVKTIGSCVFSDCRQLSSASISSILKEIPWGTFQVCALKEILIPQSVTSIVNNAFWQCNLSDVYVEWGDPSTVNCVVEAFDSYSTCTLHVPVGSKDAYASTEPWSKFQNIVEDESLGIGDVRYDPNGESLYTISGVKVESKNVKSLPKGIYVQGRKKIVKK